MILYVHRRSIHREPDRDLNHDTTQRLSSDGRYSVDMDFTDSIGKILTKIEEPITPRLSSILKDTSHIQYMLKTPRLSQILRETDSHKRESASPSVKRLLVETDLIENVTKTPTLKSMLENTFLLSPRRFSFSGMDTEEVEMDLDETQTPMIKDQTQRDSLVPYNSLEDLMANTDPAELSVTNRSVEASTPISHNTAELTSHYPERQQEEQRQFTTSTPAKIQLFEMNTPLSTPSGNYNMGSPFNTTLPTPILSFSALLDTPAKVPPPPPCFTPTSATPTNSMTNNNNNSSGSNRTNNTPFIGSIELPTPTKFTPIKGKDEQMYPPKTPTEIDPPFTLNEFDTCRRSSLTTSNRFSLGSESNCTVQLIQKILGRPPVPQYVQPETPNKSCDALTSHDTLRADLDFKSFVTSLGWRLRSSSSTVSEFSLYSFFTLLIQHENQNLVGSKLSINPGFAFRYQSFQNVQQLIFDLYESKRLSKFLEQCTSLSDVQEVPLFGFHTNLFISKHLPNITQTLATIFRYKEKMIQLAKQRVIRYQHSNFVVEISNSLHARKVIAHMTLFFGEIPLVKDCEIVTLIGKKNNENLTPPEPMCIFELVELIQNKLFA